MLIWPKSKTDEATRVDKSRRQGASVPDICRCQSEFLARCKCLGKLKQCELLRCHVPSEAAVTAICIFSGWNVATINVAAYFRFQQLVWCQDILVAISLVRVVRSHSQIMSCPAAWLAQNFTTIGWAPCSAAQPCCSQQHIIWPSTMTVTAERTGFDGHSATD